MEKFDTGATRNSDLDKHDPEGFLNPEVMHEYFRYMHKNRFLDDGSMRESDNWQKGIPQWRYMKSLWRHFLDLWRVHRQIGNNNLEPNSVRNEQLIEDCCGVIFNTMGYLSQELKKPSAVPNGLPPQIHPLGPATRLSFQENEDPGDQTEKTDWGV